ncbi:MAG: hypothetical protein GPOALKHO_001855 [Sodalis sp.]|nr:MAG: hypothetical protein GPOALKHO_001855 [Sodalis sp.]
MTLMRSIVLVLSSHLCANALNKLHQQAVAQSLQALKAVGTG